MSLVYVAGPMRGRKDYNFPQFDQAADYLRSQGWHVLSPAEHDRQLGFDETDPRYAADGWQDPTVIPGAFDFGVAFAWDVQAIFDSDAIYLLEGWEHSTGARIELSIAKFIGRSVLVAVGAVHPDDLPTVPTATPMVQRAGDPRFHALLGQIADLHDRKQADYGTDHDPFANVRGSQDWGVTPWLGAMIRANDKVKRLQTFAQKGTLANEGVEDSLMDLAVYALIALVLYREQAAA